MSLALVEEIRACTLCESKLPHPPRPVLQLDPSARIVLASQAPGRAVQASGIPFDDPSGQRLRGWLGVSPDEFYDETNFAIVPMAFCYPGRGASGDLPPRPECARQWRMRVLEVPAGSELVVAIGSYAVAYHTGERGGLTATVRDWQRWSPQLIPVPHPSPRNTHWLQKHPWFEAEVLPELRRRVREILGRATASGQVRSAKRGEGSRGERRERGGG